MSYFNKNMSVDNARKLMFQLTDELKEDKSEVKKMWDEYDEIRPILYDKEYSVENHVFKMTS